MFIQMRKRSCQKLGMCAETIVKNSKQGARMIDEADLMEHLRCLGFFGAEETW